MRFPRAAGYWSNTATVLIELAEKTESAIRLALEFLGRKFRSSSNRSGAEQGSSQYYYCHLYAIERVGALTRRHLIGSRAWYPNGAEYLLATQREDGAFRDGSCMGPQDVLGTCFALLFHQRSTPPAVVTLSDV